MCLKIVIEQYFFTRYIEGLKSPMFTSTIQNNHLVPIAHNHVQY